MELVAWDGGEGGGGCSGRGEAPAEEGARRSCDAHGRQESAIGRGSRGYRLIQFVELGSFEAARGRSVSAVLSAVFPSHELEDFFGTQEYSIESSPQVG